MTRSEAELRLMDQQDEVICRKLRKVGVEVLSVWDLLEKNGLSKEMVSILLKCLNEDLHDRILEGVVRALSDPSAKRVAVAPMLDLYDRLAATVDKDGQQTDSLRWAIGNAMLTIADSSAYERIIEIVKNKRNGDTRQNFILWLGKIKKQRARSIPVLKSLLKQPYVEPHALIAIRRLKAVELRADVERMLSSDRALVVREAKKTLAKFDELPE